jgi:lysophospholipase L1-like esterase
MAWQSFVALGDSFTEGMDDPDPSAGGYRGWADLVATALAAANPGLNYANLAIRGRLFHNVVDEQLPLALAMKPDLVSFAAGGNDALRPSFDGPSLLARYDETIAALRATGADVILFRSADLTRRLPARRVVLPRATVINDGAAAIAAKHGAYLVDLWADDEFATNGALWSVDRLHLSTAGHRRVAAHVLTVLGVEADPEWLAAVPSPGTPSWPAARLADARWAARYLAPWVKRRLTGRSSGDLVGAKRPELGPVPLSAD